MKINIKRLMENLHKTGDIGYKEKDGITREGFSQEYYQALNVLERLFLESNLKVIKDEVGNILGRREGKDVNKKSIMIGSHLDTVKNGGLYDGNLGIIAALEVVKCLNENNISMKHPIEIVAFNAEEGSEMGGTFGSRVMTGRQNLKEKDLEEKLSHYGLNLENIKNSTKNMNKVGVFLELHIEQGGFLEENKYDIGIVDGIVGITRYKITIKGESNHAGTTPMNLRKDPIKILGKVIGKINDLTLEYKHPFVVTIGDLEVKPGMYNVIPREVTLLLELRDLEQKNIDDFILKLKEYSQQFYNFKFDFQETINKPSRLLDKNIIEKIKIVTEKNNYRGVEMSSGAGHSAKEFTYKVPTGMIFIPSVGGISHSPLEYSTEKQIAKGTQILLDTVLELDKEEILGEVIL